MYPWGDWGGVLKMECRAERAQSYRKKARKYPELPTSGVRDITMNFVHRKLADRYIWMAEDLERREDLAHTLVAHLASTNREAQRRDV
jgi:hypothetical protein